MERILEFEPLYATMIMTLIEMPPPPVLTRQNADRLSSEDYMSDLSDSIDDIDSDSD
jgi:hypothetical protein